MIMQHPKQLSLPFAEANYDIQPLTDEAQYRIKRLETDYLKLKDGRVKVEEAEFTYLKDGRILTKYSSSFLD